MYCIFAPQNNERNKSKIRTTYVTLCAIRCQWNIDSGITPEKFIHNNWNIKRRWRGGRRDGGWHLFDYLFNIKNQRTSNKNIGASNDGETIGNTCDYSNMRHRYTTYMSAALNFNVPITHRYSIHYMDFFRCFCRLGKVYFVALPIDEEVSRGARKRASEQRKNALFSLFVSFMVAPFEWWMRDTKMYVSRCWASKKQKIKI